MKRIIYLSILAVILAVFITLVISTLNARRAAGAAEIESKTEGIECEYDKDAVFYCIEDLGCDADPFFNMTVAQMATELGLPDDNYRPCRIDITTEDHFTFTVDTALQYRCWDYRPICGITGFDYAWAWTSGEAGTHIESVYIWLQKHIPNYVPLAIERSGLGDQTWRIGDTTFPSPGYPPPPSFPEPPPYP